MKKHLLLMQRIIYLSTVAIFSAICTTASLQAQEEWSVAHEWNEAVLFAITEDFGRPTIHARNLYHTSAAMYDAWAAYEPSHDTWLLGKTRGAYNCAFDGVAIPSDAEEKKAAQEEAMSFAVYRLVSHRYQAAPGFFDIQTTINAMMDDKGYDRFNISQNYVTGGPAELGNYIANEIIAYGYLDGANELNGYQNQYYEAQNDTVFPELPGNPSIIDPNLWQPISLTNQLDQSGEPILETPPFLSPEWGDMVPFSLTEDDKVLKQRDGYDWNIYHDPGPPALLDPENPTGLEDMYKWGFTMVSVWQSHLDPDDETMWDISPASIGNVPSYPENFEDYPEFYNFFDGGDPSQGHTVNPKTGEPYEPQIVKRADYGRVLAEFWADGPESYTPPGHWFEIVNRAVLDHPDFERKWMGEGEELDALEYDVKLYFALGGSLYDAAISAWSIKGFYDYLRPVSAIRYMCDQGQSTDNTLDNYDPAGIPLIPGYVEVVEEGDPLAGDLNEHVGKIKLYTWRGPDFIQYADTSNEFNPQDPTNYAGVGWILGENWWPWQRPNFVSPPFAGYISGHSTFSSTAAELMETVTGDPFFPGGMGEFVAEQDEFLHFEIGPSEPITLQWATYRDASDQTSLSRIWGGIHPPVDDIPGRHIGMEIGDQALIYANEYFSADRPVVESVDANLPVFNITNIGETVTVSVVFDREMNTSVNPTLLYLNDIPTTNSLVFENALWVSDQEYQINYELLDGEEKLSNIILKISNAVDAGGKVQNPYLANQPFIIDTDRPEVEDVAISSSLLNDQLAVEDVFQVTITIDEEADTDVIPEVEFTSIEDLSASLFYTPEESTWLDETTFVAVFALIDNNEEVENIGINITGIMDASGNQQIAFSATDVFSIDTRNPEYLDQNVNNSVLNIQSVGSNALVVTLEFDEEMNTSLTPVFTFPNDNPMGTSLNLNPFNSEWLNNQTYQMSFNLLSAPAEYGDIVIQLESFNDLAGNSPAEPVLSDLFIIDTQRPQVSGITPSSAIISDSEVGDSVFEVNLQFNEEMDMDQIPILELSSVNDVSGSIAYAPFDSEWQDEFNFTARFDVIDENIEVEDIDIEVNFGKDAAGNNQNTYQELAWIDLDTRNPELNQLIASTSEINNDDVGTATFSLLAVFDEVMNTNEIPVISFDGPVEVESILSVNTTESDWVNNSTYHKYYDVLTMSLIATDIGVILSNSRDMAGNNAVNVDLTDVFSINTEFVGIGELGSDIEVAFYPNPISTGQVLNMSISQPLNHAIIAITSMSGRIVAQNEMVRMESGLNEVPINGLSHGVYFVQVTADEGALTHKIVVVE